MRHFNNVLKLEKKQKAKLHYSEQDEASFKLENKFLQLLWESDTEIGLGNQMKMPTSVTFVPQFRIFLVFMRKKILYSGAGSNLTTLSVP